MDDLALLVMILAPVVSPRAVADGFVARMKPVISGFIDMQDIAWHNSDDGKPIFTLDNVRKFPGLFGGIVLNATWAEMQHRRAAI